MLKKILNKETILYLVFGILTTVVNFIVFFIMQKITKVLILNNTVAWFVSVLFAFITNRNIVFNSNGNKLKEISLFFTSRIFSLILDNIFMFILVEKFLINETFSKLAVNIIVIIVNYILSKTLIFTNKKDT